MCAERGPTWLARPIAKRQKKNGVAIDDSKSIRVNFRMRLDLWNYATAGILLTGGGWQPRAKHRTLIALSAAAPEAMRNVVQTNYSPTSEYSRVIRKRTITKENRSDVRQWTGLSTRELRNSCLIGRLLCRWSFSMDCTVAKSNLA